MIREGPEDAKKPPVGSGVVLRGERSLQAVDSQSRNGKKTMA